MEVVSTGVTKRAKLQSNRQHQQTKTQFFRRRMPFLSPNQQRRALKKILRTMKKYYKKKLSGGTNYSIK